MSSILGNPHIRHLIAQAESADELRQKLLDEHGRTDTVDAAIEQVLRDLGEAVWRMVRSTPLGDAEPTEIPEPAVGQSESVDVRWFTEEVAIGEVLFDPGDLGDTRDELTADLTTALAEPNTMTLDDVERDRRNPACALGALRATVPPRWAADLDKFCRSLGPLDPSTDPQVLGREVSRLTRAASRPDRWNPLPEDIRTALLGMLAARIRRVCALLQDPPGGKESMKHLHAYRMDQDLPHVAPLDPRAAPERGAWEADARAWWVVLQRPSS